MDAVGLVNEEVAYVATRSGIKALHREGPPTPVIEVNDEEIKAFHLCHHRSSLLYEVLSRDGGQLSIFEYSLPARTKVLVKEFQDAMPAVSLACADQWLLRSSPVALRAVHLPSGVQSELRRFPGGEEESEGGSSGALGSISVAYAADIIAHAEVYASVPSNRTIIRLRIHDDGEGALREELSESLLAGGDGSDGPLAIATVQSPQHLVWTRGKVIFTDGCALRELSWPPAASASASAAANSQQSGGGRVRTLLGSSAACVRPGNETLEPVPWASRLSRPQGLAAAAEGTAGGGAVLLLTEAQVVHISEERNTCATASGVGVAEKDESTAGAACAATAATPAAAGAGGRSSLGCGWAEGPAAEEHLCLECAALERWAAGQRPAADVCSLEVSPRAGMRYALSGCGCAGPSSQPEEKKEEEEEEEREAERLQTELSVLVVLGVVVTCAFLYRRGRRVTAMREIYGVDTAEFHTFTDEDVGARQQHAAGLSPPYVACP